MTLFRAASVLFVLGLLNSCEKRPEEPSTASSSSMPEATTKPLLDWPPQLGKRYPDLTLLNHQGEEVKLSSYRGKPILIKAVGMSCPACNAFAGGNEPGHQGFRSVRPQANLRSLAHYLPQYSGGIRLNDPRLVVVHLLLYNPELKAPSLEEARAWAKHYKIQSSNEIVLLGDERFIRPESYRMIPGFQLVDSSFVLKSDSTGHHPRHNLYTHLLPMLGDLVRNN